MSDDEKLVDIGRGAGWDELWAREDVCGYYPPYVGPCRRVPPEGRQYCAEHEGILCVICGRQAVGETRVYFVNSHDDANRELALCERPECRIALCRTRCMFDIAQRGHCGRPLKDGERYCHEHTGTKCCVCGEQATGHCHVASTRGVCGAPLCSKKACHDQHGTDGRNH